MRDNNDTNQTTLSITIDQHNCQIHTILDNLGKGSASAVIQNANLMLGLEETLGLE